MQLFDKPSGTWLGTPTNEPLPGLAVTGGVKGFHEYLITHLLSTRHVFVSVVRDGGEPTTGRLFSPSALLDVSSWPPPSAWAMHSSRLTSAAGDVSLIFPTAVMLPWRTTTSVGADEVWVIGGADKNVPWDNQTGRPAISHIWSIKRPHDADSTWSIKTDLNHPRIFANTVVLPTMQIFVVGGSTNHFRPYASNGTEVLAQPVYEAELYDLLAPSSGWQSVSVPHVSPRLYHSMAVLLPDARVLVVGGYKGSQDPFSPNHHTQVSWTYSDAEIFSPPYLGGGSKRLVVTSAPTNVPYGTTFTVGINVVDEPIPPPPWVASDEVDFGFLVRCASVTHQFDWDQKSMMLDVISKTNGTVNFRIPSATNPAENGDAVLPPGYYMLFVVRKPTSSFSLRVPSLARFLRIP